MPDFPNFFFFIFPITSEKKKKWLYYGNLLILMTNIVFWIVEIVINNSKFNQFSLMVILGFVEL